MIELYCYLSTIFYSWQRGAGGEISLPAPSSAHNNQDENIRIMKRSMDKDTAHA